ncbi:unnamed protein product [marine sediment metagenome]|uniref:Uncharacterized protein n=1 Tax=marine sediment metagenome TaxID=412755 RepID=X1DDW1_9ZZZZ
MTNAKYLTIANESINTGDIYYTVQAINPFNLQKHRAGSENNVLHYCYFKNKNEAEYYKRLCRLNRIISDQIKEIEIAHHNK